jgi:hypothetical protein
VPRWSDLRVEKGRRSPTIAPKPFLRLVSMRLMEPQRSLTDIVDTSRLSEVQRKSLHSSALGTQLSGPPDTPHAASIQHGGHIAQQTVLRAFRVVLTQHVSVIIPACLR